MNATEDTSCFLGSVKMHNKSSTISGCRLIKWDPPQRTRWAQSCHRPLSGLSLLPLWLHLFSSLPPRSGTWVYYASWMEILLSFLFSLNRSSTYLACVDRVPILWAGSSALTTTSTDIVASTSLLFHSPRPKITRCLGSGRGTWTWKHFRLDLLRMKHVWAVALTWKTTANEAFRRYLMNWRGASRTDHST